MTRSDELTTFVKEALTEGVPRAEIEGILLKSGWSKRQARDALATFADVTFPTPVPRPRPYTDAREAFLYGLLFVSLYVSAYHLGVLIFAFIERAFPQVVSAPSLREAIRWPASALVVALPVFIYVSRLIDREVRLDPSKRASEIRSKLTYFTLFVSAAVMIGILAGLVYSFLGGELTIRFVLKSLTAGGIAAGIFGHYLRDMRVEGTEAAAENSRGG
jgi:hypothetical protein